MLVGCGPDKGGGSAGPETTTVLSDGAAAPTTGDGSPTTSSNSTGESPTGGSTTAGSETTGGTSTTNTTSGPEEARCEDFCANAHACFPRLEVAECVANACYDATGTPECQAATEALFTCMAGMDCDEIFALADHDDYGPCTDPLAMEAAACTGEKACETQAGSNGNSCDVEFLCLGEPPMSMECDATGCVCLVNGEQVGECSTDGVCAKPPMSIFALAETCCDFPGAPVLGGARSRWLHARRP